VETIDVAVVGAGVTGLAAARALALRGRSTCVLERHPRAGMETSTHNSGVIHAGLYYPPGSLKARMCVDGRRLLYDFCERRGVPHARCGKLVVAHDASEIPAIEALCARGVANGVEHLELVDRGFIRRREPAVNAVAALWSPVTGIVSADDLVRALRDEGIEAGAVFLPGTPLLGAEPDAAGVALETPRERIRARVVVNAAGLYADDVSATLGGERFTIHPARGEYAEFVPAKRALVNALVYPTPDAHGLGVHLVKSVSGQVWVGPTVKFQRRKDDYEDDRLPLEYFARAAARLVDGITIDDLRLSGSGIRAKLHGASEPFADFLIRLDRENPFVIQAAGIESPGLTSCLAVGDLVRDLALEIL
jgi:L-2-hydroxyglutarate oxidase LhgO